MLGYAEVPSQFGVEVERRPDALTITVPPPWWARALSPSAILPISLVILLGNAIAAFVQGRWVGLASILAIAAGITIAHWVAAWGPGRKQQQRPFAARFEVRGNTLRVLWRHGDQERDVTCHRDEIVSIRGDLYRMGLTIRIRKREIIELLHSRPKVMRVWLANALGEALGMGGASGAPSRGGAS